MDVAAAADELRRSREFGEHFTAWRTVPARPARFGEFPAAISAELRQALARRGIERLYAHQAQAVEAALAGESLVVVTPTASGKTLCYNLPVIESILGDPSARAIYLFPTKALAQDQLAELHGLVTELGRDVKAYTYDGDTAPQERRAVRAAGHIVVTNPDMLHTGILSHHTKWVKLFENLRYVVIDELHNYRGVFGSHVANVIRRLRRICAFYGSDPQFICCSATIANPAELAEAVTGRAVRLVDQNGAPSGERIVALYNPPVVNRELGIRRSQVFAVRDLAARLLAKDVQTIVFAQSRKLVEILTTYLRERTRQLPGSAERIAGYRGGYLPNERRQIERALRAGEIRGVVATNALELGIDIGGLDAAVLAGYPGSVASTLQQMGRAGRRSSTALAVMVGSSSPLDQWVVSHPDFLFEAPPEAGRINPDNSLILASHVKCAAFELPFDEREQFGTVGNELLDLLADEGVLHRAGGRYHWMSESFPAGEISLRSAFTDNFVIIESGPIERPGMASRPARVIGEVDRIAAPLELHEEAIYLHQGVQYQVERLDWEEKKAYVRRVDVDYYTDANLAVELRVLEPFEQSSSFNAERAWGEVSVTYLATIFKKIKLDTRENIGWGKIRLPQEDLHTTAYWFSLPAALTAGLAREEVQSGVSGLGHLVANLAPLYLLCDRRDLHSVAEVKDTFTGLPTVYVYEAVPGGVGFSERLYDLHQDLLLRAGEAIAGCTCDAGCPSCVGPPLEAGPDGKAAAIRILERMFAGPGVVTAGQGSDE